MITSVGKRLCTALFGALVSASIAACGGGSKTTDVTVPNVDGSSQAAATSTLLAAGLTVGTVTTQSSSTVPSGNVISESPASGSSIATGSSVALVVSSGPPPVTTTVTLGGTLVGLAGGGTVNVVNGSNNVALSANASFSFPTAVTTGATYSVSIGTQPSGQTCGVQNGAGTAGTSNITNVVVYCTDNFSTSTLSGAFTFIRDDITAQADQLLNLSFDGAGNFSGSSTLNTAGTITNPSFSGTYSVATVSAIPQLTTLIEGLSSASGQGAAEFNGSAVAVVAANPEDGGQPNLLIGVAPTTSASVSSIDGTYTTVALESTSPARSSIGTLTASNGTGTFTTQTRNTDGSIDMPSSSTNSGTYTVTAAGAITVGSGSGVSGAVSADGDLIVLAPITSTGDGGNQAVLVAVKQGSGVTSSSLNGVYVMVSLQTGASSTANIGKAYSVVLVNGQFFGTYDQNDAGTPSTGNSVSGTYTLASDGTMSLSITGGPTLTGRTSADGNVFALTDTTSGDAPILLLGLSQSGQTAVTQ